MGQGWFFGRVLQNYQWVQKVSNILFWECFCLEFFLMKEKFNIIRSTSPILYLRDPQPPFYLVANKIK